MPNTPDFYARLPERRPGSNLENDFRDFRAAAKQALEAELEEEPSADAVWLTNTYDTLAANHITRLHIAMKHLGKGVRFSRQNAQGLVPPFSGIGVWATAESLTAVREIQTRAISATARDPHFYLSYITTSDISRVFPFALDPTHSEHGSVTGRLAAMGMPPADVTHWLERAFLTSALMTTAVAPNMVDEDWRNRYEELSQRGVKPLGYEELYGISYMMVRRAMEAMGGALSGE